NIFVRGLTGTGRMTLLKRLMEEIKPSCPETKDRCYVRNFKNPDRPALLTLPRGRGRALARMMDEVAEFVHRDLKQALETDALRAGRAALEEESHAQIATATKPFEEELAMAGLGLVQVNAGAMVQTTILPIVDGKPIPPDVYQHLRETGQVTEEQHDETQKRIQSFMRGFEEISREVERLRNEHMERTREMVRNQVRSILARLMGPIREHFPQERVGRFLDDIVEDLCKHRMEALEKDVDFSRLYRVNPVVDHEAGTECPVVVETSPTLRNLLGSIDQRVGASGAAHSDHMMIRAGSLLRADSGYLLIEARDLLTEPGAWRMLVRALRCGRAEIVPSEMMTPWMASTLKPEPIELNVKVILLGDSGLYYALDQLDPDFPELFKVLADFDSVIDRDEAGIAHYAGVLARVTKEEGLAALDRSAVAELIEPLRRRGRGGDEEPAIGEERADRMHARRAVFPYRGQVGDVDLLELLQPQRRHLLGDRTLRDERVDEDVDHQRLSAAALLRWGQYLFVAVDDSQHRATRRPRHNATMPEAEKSRKEILWTDIQYGRCRSRRASDDIRRCERTWRQHRQRP
ncbi:MAG: AAA family ATPase, partial [Myxococcales bacterium]|nr:AAA family ATPase [Myxococcales bacterium]